MLLLDHHMEEMLLVGLVPEVEALAPLVEEPPPLGDTESQPPLPLPLPNIPVGGRLAHFAQNWAEITDDKWVLSLIRKGYRIPFKERPILSPNPTFFQQPLSLQLEEEVASLLSKGAVEEIIPECPGYYSRIFLVPKKNGKLRLIIDLSMLNRSVYTETFKMEIQRKVRNAVQLNDWAFSLDLTDAYMHIPIHHRSRKYLRFMLRGRVYQFKALPFGLSTSPFVFTRLMIVIATFLRRRAITLHPYLDDWLARNQNRQKLLEHRQFIMWLINSLGLIINYEKSDLVPAQVFTFIGMEFLTHINIVRVPQARQMKILDSVRIFLQKTSVSARDFLSLLGQLNAAADFVMLGRLHLRPLQMSLHNQWQPQKFPLCHQIGITTKILQHLKWWLQEDLYRHGIPMKIDPPSHTIFTDASLSGWGAHVEPEGLLFHGLWTEDQSRLHINVLEMKAIFLSLTRAVHKVKNSTVLVSTDNTTVVAYIRHQGGTHSTVLSEEVWNILNLCLAHNIQLLAKHIPGRFNTLADRMSRIDKPISTEWSLNQEIANKIFQIMDFPSIDLFATRLNHRLPLYVSPIPDQKALSIDAISMDWNRIHAYAFPPFHLIQTVINKVRISQCRIVLIAPLWPDRPWFPELLGLLVSPPVSLPVIPNLLAQLKGRILHQNPGHLQLHAWELSSNLSEINNFQAKLQSMSPKLEETRPLKSMMQNGKSSVIGRKIDPIQATPQIVADFLTFLFPVKKCQVSTIRGYRSTISNTLKYRTGYNFGSHPVLSELIKSFAKQRPVDRSLAPKWDLASVLLHMCKAPFEPLDKASLFHLSVKTVFLVTLATARRVSEVHAFSIDSDHLRFSNLDGSLISRTQLGFLTKNQLPSRAPDSIIIPKLSNFCRKSDNFNRMLCPVRAVKIYLNKTKSLRKHRKRLFIPTQGNQDLAKPTLSRWVKYAIKNAYDTISKNPLTLFKPRAHELRAISASWAYMNYIPLEEILKPAVWSSTSLFASHYLRDFREQTENLRAMGPIIAAQKVVGGRANPVSHQDK